MSAGSAARGWLTAKGRRAGRARSLWAGLRHGNDWRYRQSRVLGEHGPAATAAAEPRERRPMEPAAMIADEPVRHISVLEREAID